MVWKEKTPWDKVFSTFSTEFSTYRVSGINFDYVNRGDWGPGSHKKRIFLQKMKENECLRRLLSRSAGKMGKKSHSDCIFI